MLVQLKDQAKRQPWLVDTFRGTRKTVLRAGFGLARTVVDRSRNHEILIVFGLRRSGNHVVINWIKEQTDGSVVFCNNINPDRSPFSARMKEFRLRARNRSARIILSYEDICPDRLLSSAPLLSVLQDSKAARVRFALVLRDPYNLFASRLRKWPERFADDDAISAQTALYAEHARLVQQAEPIWRDAPLVPILYNDLIRDPATRSRVAEALGIRDGDRGLETVPVYGHGSSFDGTDRQVAAMRNQVFTRWREMETDPTFQEVIANRNLQQIGETLFGMAAPTEPT
jgi:hypothetical protein